MTGRVPGWIEEMLEEDFNDRPYLNTDLSPTTEHPEEMLQRFRDERAESLFRAYRETVSSTSSYLIFHTVN
jgi:hypothetical protein